MDRWMLARSYMGWNRGGARQLTAATPPAAWTPRAPERTLADADDDEHTAPIPEFARLLALSLPEVDVPITNGDERQAAEPPPESGIQVRASTRPPTLPPRVIFHPIEGPDESTEVSTDVARAVAIVSLVVCSAGIAAIASFLFFALVLAPGAVTVRTTRWPAFVDVHRAVFASADVRLEPRRLGARSKATPPDARPRRVVPRSRASSPAPARGGIVRAAPF